MFFKKKKPKVDMFTFVEHHLKELNKEMSVTLTQNYKDEKTGQTIQKPETKNAFTWLPTLLIEINQTLVRIEAKLK